MTQETLFKLCTSSVKKFFSMIKERQPDKTTIKNSTIVENNFNRLLNAIRGTSEDDDLEIPEPLLSLELQGNSEVVGTEEKSK